ncbi:MAG: hypothetical protein FWD29_06410 [Micrococcales bacterium]|nr:hypothetical protein [Micrococcales bacterium]
MNKTKKLMALALAGGLCFGSASAAYAANGALETDDPESPIEAKITKILTLPVGTDIPTETFTFVFTPEEVDGDSSSTAKSSMPTVTASVDISASSDSDVDDGAIIVIQESDDFVDGINWPHAGVYVYTLTESAALATSGMTYSGASYEVTFWVENCKDTDQCHPGLYVAGLGVKTITGDDGNPVTEEKVDPTPGGDDDTYFYSQVIFNNGYIEGGDGGDPKDPNKHMLSISKAVDGAYADQTMYFPFELKVTKPSTGVTGTPIYRAFVVEDQGSGLVVVTSTANCASSILKNDTTYGNYCEVTSGAMAATAINIRHGQQIVFTDLHVGATYEAVELYDSNYSAEGLLVVNGATAVGISPDMAGDDLTTGAQIIGAGENSASITNTRLSAPPEGISLNDWPFIILIVLALAGGSAYVYTTVRRGKKSHA